MSDCIFCKIAAGEIPAATLYEDDQFRVILDVAPASKGHALILPKVHAKDLYELPDAVAEQVLPLAKKLSTKMVQALQCEGLNVVQNNGEAAGQTVFHFHVHLIPRYKDDTVKIGWKMGTLDDTQKAQLLDLLQ
ncbi:MAG: HIT family protein [Lachnospiraceae bacterium]